jgi:hypothetical protein
MPLLVAESTTSSLARGRRESGANEMDVLQRIRKNRRFINAAVTDINHHIDTRYQAVTLPWLELVLATSQGNSLYHLQAPPRQRQHGR